MRSAKSILEDQQATVALLLAVVLNSMGTESMEWTPVILREELDNKYGVSISDFQSDKIQSGFALLMNNDFETYWNIFENIGHLLVNQGMMHDAAEHLEAEEIAGALGHALLLVGEYEGRMVFSDEVEKYAGLVFWDYGMYRAPSIMPTAIMPVVEYKGADLEKAEAGWKDKDTALRTIYTGIQSYVRGQIESYKSTAP